MANAVTNQLLSDMRILHTQTSRGIWGKGATTHETVSRREGEKPYHIASFRHADDASFIDACHEHLPAILDELEAFRAAKARIDATAAERNGREMAPETSLPSWTDCDAVIDSVERPATALEVFIHENDPADRLESSWFYYRLSEVLAEASMEAHFELEDCSLNDAARTAIEGMSVSVDVSTGEGDAGNRYFGTVTEIMDANSSDKHGVVLLVQDASANFNPPSA